MNNSSRNDLDPMPVGVEPNSEAGACDMHFGDIETAIETAKLAQSMITDRAKIEECAKFALDEDFDDM